MPRLNPLYTHGLIGAVGGAGIGALTNPEDKVRGAFTGGLAGGAAGAFSGWRQGANLAKLEASTAHRIGAAESAAQRAQKLHSVEQQQNQLLRHELDATRGSVPAHAPSVPGSAPGRGPISYSPEHEAKNKELSQVVRNKAQNELPWQKNFDPAQWELNGQKFDYNTWAQQNPQLAAQAPSGWNWQTPQAVLNRRTPTIQAPAMGAPAKVPAPPRLPAQATTNPAFVVPPVAPQAAPAMPQPVAPAGPTQSMGPVNGMAPTQQMPAAPVSPVQPTPPAMPAQAPQQTLPSVVGWQQIPGAYQMPANTVPMQTRTASAKHASTAGAAALGGLGGALIGGGASYLSQPEEKDWRRIGVSAALSAGVGGIGTSVAHDIGLGRGHTEGVKSVHRMNAADRAAEMQKMRESLVGNLSGIDPNLINSLLQA